MLTELSSWQIAEWMAYYNLEPFGEQVEWLRSGAICSVIANVNRGQKGKVFTPEDFMPPKEEHNKHPRKQTVEQQERAIRQIYAYAKKHRLTKDGKQ